VAGYTSILPLLLLNCRRLPALYADKYTWGKIYCKADRSPVTKLRSWDNRDVFVIVREVQRQKGSAAVQKTAQEHKLY
jgi:hypothetical protein